MDRVADDIQKIIYPGNTVGSIYLQIGIDYNRDVDFYKFISYDSVMS